VIRALGWALLALLGGALALVLGYFGFQAYLKWLTSEQSPPVSYQ
jgi:cytochrome c oxidase subunit IV